MFIWWGFPWAARLQELLNCRHIAHSYFKSLKNKNNRVREKFPSTSAANNAPCTEQLLPPAARRDPNTHSDLVPSTVSCPAGGPNCCKNHVLTNEGSTGANNI